MYSIQYYAVYQTLSVYSFMDDTDPDPGSETFVTDPRTRPSFDTYPDPDPGKKVFSTRKILNIWFKKLSKLCLKKYRFIFVFNVFVDADDTDLDPDPAVAKTCRLNLHFFGHPSYVTIFLIGILSILIFTVLHMYEYLQYENKRQTSCITDK